MELNDSVLMRQQGARLMKPLPRPAGAPPEFEEVVLESLGKLEIGLEYTTPRHNTLVRTADHLFSLHGPDGTDPVTIDTSQDNDTQAVIEHAIQAGAGVPPADPTAVFRVCLTVTTPQLTNAVKAAGHLTADADVMLEVHPEWAPLAAARFRLLVEQQYFVGTRFYCIVPGLLVQFGLPGIPSLGMQWRKLPLCVPSRVFSHWWRSCCFTSTDPPLACLIAGLLAFLFKEARLVCPFKAAVCLPIFSL